MYEAMDTHFARIVDTITDMGIVVSKNYSVFIIYAYDNTNIGKANGGLVKKLIQRLKDAGVTLLSDRSPWYDNRPSKIKTRGANDKNPSRDILWSQMRLPPKCRYPKSADIAVGNYIRNKIAIRHSCTRRQSFIHIEICEEADLILFPVSHPVLILFPT